MDRNLDAVGSGAAVSGVHQQKLSDIGARIAQVAHELNVPLSLIVGSLQSLEQYADASARYIRATEKAAEGDPLLQDLRAQLDLDYLVENAPALLEICREGTRRLHHVVNQLRSYTRAPAAARSQAIDLAPVLNNAVNLAQYGRTMLPVVTRKFEPAPAVAGEIESLGQALGNVITNAFDAVSMVDNPHVWISLRPTDRADDAGQPASVEIRVCDNGPGVPSHIRSRIFEPFFTTKGRRSGMGLGLAITREIIEGYGGTIGLADGTSGTTFVIRLPATADA